MSNNTTSRVSLANVAVTGDYTPGQVNTLAKAAGREAAKAEKSTRSARIAQAKVTALTVRLGLIGEGGQWDTATDYARTIGTSKSNVTGLKRLGVALVAGINPWSPEDAERWDVLSSKVNVKQIGAVLDGEHTLSQIRDAVDTLIREQAEAKAEGASKRTPRTAGDGSEAKAEGEGDAVTVTLTPAQAVDAALQTLRRHLPSLDAEAWADAESRMGDLITREVTVRAKASATKAKAAKPRAPRKAKAATAA